MVGYIDSEMGNISIDTEVIAQYAGHAALDCFGIVGMATISMRDGLAKLLKGDNVSKGVNVQLIQETFDAEDGSAEIKAENQLIIDFHIIVAYGVNIKTVVNNLISSVKYQIEDYTSMKVKTINVFVEGVRVID